MNYGYIGEILKINLTTKEILIEKLGKEDLKKFIGGSGLGAKYLYELTGPDTDPLGEENALIFMTGPFTGTKTFSSDRFEVITKSPATGIYAESNCGGKWGSALKRSGYDGVIIIGISDKPVYIDINNKEVKILNASSLWGLDTFKTYKELKNNIDKKAEVACIGQAGENLIKYAAISTCGEHARIAARAGVGTVMGSKKLKAIVVSGNQEFELHDSKGFKDFYKKNVKKVGSSDVAEFLRDNGTNGVVEGCELIGDMPIKNWTGKNLKNIDKLYSDNTNKTILKKKYYCGSCVVGCGRVVEVTSGKFKTDGMVGGSEYETIGMLGSNLLITDMDAVAKLNELCNKYGIDTISTGSVIGMMMECYEKGLIDREFLDGVDLVWGNADAVIEIIHKIGKAEGVGRLLGEGVKKIAEKIGSPAIEFAVHVKGLESPAHDPRAKNSLALGYATSNRGACHLQHYGYDLEDGLDLPDMGIPETLDRQVVDGKAEFVAKMQNLMCMFDSLSSCKFMMFCTFSLKPMVEALEHITGFGLDEKEFLKTGERIFNLKRMYNIRCGVTRKDDTLPPRFLTLNRNDDKDISELPPLGRMLDEYYKIKNWDEIGVPTKEKLTELGLEEYIV